MHFEISLKEILGVLLFVSVFSVAICFCGKYFYISILQTQFIET